jgi:integrase/recombinase XerD
MIKDYLDYIFNSTLAQNTINTYKAIILKYQVSDIDKTINKLNKTYHQPAYFRQNQAVLVSYYRFTKNYQAVEILKALRLPPLAMEYKAVFRREFLLDKTSIKADDNDKKIFAKNLIRFYFETGIRAHEINNVIRFSNETMTIKGKGGKIREIFYKLDT